jgi:hypothetical protein
MGDFRRGEREEATGDCGDALPAGRDRSNLPSLHDVHLLPKVSFAI